MSTDTAERTAMSGLAIAQHMLRIRSDPPMGKTLDFTLVEVAEGRAVFQGTPGPHAYNPMGIVHGGYAATLLDSACGIATLTKLEAGDKFTTLELKVAYHKAMDERTGPVLAEAVVTMNGRRVAFTEARLTDKAGRLLASATSTLLIIAP